MKHTLIITLLSLPLYSFAQDGKFVINGKMDKIDVPTKIYLTSVIDDVMSVDSATIQNHEFHFEGTVAGPIKATLFINNIDANDKDPVTIQYKNNMRIFVLEAGEINVHGKEVMRNAVVSSKLNDQEKRYKAQLRDVNKAFDHAELQLALLQSSKKELDTSTFKSVYSQYQLAQQFRKMVQQRYINDNPKSIFSLIALEEVAGYTYDPVFISTKFEALDSTVRNTQEGSLFKAELDRGMNLLAGGQAPDFEVKDLRTGNNVKLSDFKGKYVLIDFWATYNEFSRNAHKIMAETYKEYADSNFTIISVTVDPPSEKDAILEAIDKDQMVWTNLGDPVRQRNDAAKTYNIFTLPQIYLIDNNGNIFSKNFPIENLKTELTRMRYPKSQTVSAAGESAN